MTEPAAKSPPTAGIWLWPEGTGVRWWTPEQTQWLELTGPQADGVTLAWQGLRERRDRLNLRYGLAAPLGERLVTALAQHERVMCYLDRHLASAWHDCPYEWLSLDGQPLLGRLTVVRDCPVAQPPELPLRPDREIGVLNLLDSAEPVQPAAAVPPGAARILDGLPASEHYLRQVDLTALAALVVIAHGTEQGGAQPFRLPGGTTWALPVERGMPPLVILLACGNDQGNLLLDSQRLLAAGARAVLAPRGRPTPAAAGACLADFIHRFRAGERLDHCLGRLQARDDAARGAGLLQLLGRGDLRLASVPTCVEQADARLAARATTESDSEALATLANRLTLACYYRSEPLEQAERALRRHLGIPRRDATGEQALLDQLDRADAACWPLTRAWTLPLTILLTEAYRKDDLPRLHKRLQALKRAHPVLPWHVYHYSSKLYYRQGRYALALQEIQQGLQGFVPQQACTQAAATLGHLVNLLVDLNLPAPAQGLHQQLDDCLARQATEEADWERHKLKDRAARIALRQGQAERAMAIYRLKYQEAHQYGGAGERELAWLLYISAWLDPRRATTWARAVAEQLQTPAVIHAIEQGDDTTLYLLRAYAIWAWRGRIQAAVDLLSDCQAALSDALYAGDAGPPGFVFACLHLCQRAGMTLPVQPPAWESIVAPLETQRYFLELAAFAALLGQAAPIANWLQRLHGERLPDRPMEWPAWVGEGGLQDWCGLSAAVRRHEQAVLATGKTVTPAQLVASGLLPL